MMRMRDADIADMRIPMIASPYLHICTSATIRISVFLGMQVRPLHDHVVVKAQKEETRTKSGIVIPDTVKEKPEQGKVIAVGPGEVLSSGQRSPMSVKVGDMVLFKKYSPDEIKVGDDEVLVIREKDILAVIE